MKQVFIKKGKVMVEEVPPPVVDRNEVLVQVHYSCISAGTELTGLESSKLPLYKRALKEPENIKKVLEMIQREGLSKTIVRVKNTLKELNPTGYSASGIVLQVGEEIKDISVGERVACAGSGFSHHAEFVAIPRNLLVKVPSSLELDSASTVALGSIALQAIRRGDIKLGEYVAVIGLGILGQLAVQMLKSAGAKVIGIDIDPRRVELALSLGIEKALNSNQENIIEETVRFSQGYGVDSVIITASTSQSELINQAMQMARKKGKIIVVGAVGLNLKREEFYKKELDLLISTSYGPGRYDDDYEIKGNDYPYSYVRWTENRNMQEYLNLLNTQRINIQPLIEKVYPLSEAPLAYEELRKKEKRPLIVLLEYNREASWEKKIIISSSQIEKDKINVGIIGAGGFASSVHLPNLKKLNHLYHLYALATKRGHRAKQISQQYKPAYITTDYQEIIHDPKVDMVLITTPHHLHVPIALEAAKEKKAIFLEKPMALNPKELKELIEVLEETKVPFMVGFNRRFSPFIIKIKELIKNRRNPMIINYRMNAGFIPPTHWVHSPEGGGRNIGEACHIYDLFTFFAKEEVLGISAYAIEPKTPQYHKHENFVATIKFKDGSLANLIYTTLGTEKVPKETMEMYFEGKIVYLHDYKNLKIWGGRYQELKTSFPDKGHLQELKIFGESIKKKDGYPIPLWELIQATEISFKVERLIRNRG